MEISIFLILGIFLVLLLGILFILFFKVSKKKPLSNIAEKENELKRVVMRLKDKSLSSTELKDITEIILKDYSKIDKFSIYEEIILRITLHPNTNTNIILNFDKELLKSNPLYKKDISKALADALAFRSI